MYIADDDLLPLDGSNIQKILDLQDKIYEFEMVSGLKLNTYKCEFLANNVAPAETQSSIYGTPIGQSIYTKFLISSTFIHTSDRPIWNFSFNRH